MKHNREKKKIRRSDPYKGFRKIVVRDQLWHWKDIAWRGVVFYDPEGNKYNARLREVVTCGESWWNPPVLPADARRYIEESILKVEPEFIVDPKAVPGKLYAYREKSMSQGPSITLENHEGGAILGAVDRTQRWARIHKHLNDQKAFLLLKAWADKEEKAAYYKILVQDIIATFKIEYPRTWGGSFVETTLEWQKQNAPTG